jgi:hypothetical protein
MQENIYPIVTLVRSFSLSFKLSFYRFYSSSIFLFIAKHASSTTEKSLKIANLKTWGLAKRGSLQNSQPIFLCGKRLTDQNQSLDYFI